MDRFADLEVAPRFWDLIAEMACDKGKARLILFALDQDDLGRFHDEFQYMSADLVSQATEIEGDTYHEEDVAGWVVSQGIRYYAQVYDHLIEFPSEVPDQGSNLKGMELIVHEERFQRPLPFQRSAGRWPTTLGRDLLR